MENITFPSYLLTKIRDFYDNPDLKTILIYAELASQKTSNGEYKLRTYRELREKYMFSAHQVRQSVRKLEEMGVVERDYLLTDQDKTRSNDFYIRLIKEVEADA